MLQYAVEPLRAGADLLQDQHRPSIARDVQSLVDGGLASPMFVLRNSSRLRRWDRNVGDPHGVRPMTSVSSIGSELCQKTRDISPGLQLSCYSLLMKPELSEWPCSVARAVDIFGDAWTLLILRDCMHGVRRFDEFQKSLQIARNTLSDRLSGLVSAGVLTKQFYQDNPPRYEYLLTEMGHDLFPVVSAILAWGDRWLDGGDGAPVKLYHETCAHDLDTQVVCGYCGEPINDSEVQLCLGPGYPDKVVNSTDFRHRLASAPGAEGGRPHAGRPPMRKTRPGP